MPDADITRRVNWLCRLLGAGALALVGVTWKLWTPQDVFPRVPLFWWAPPHWLDWTALAVLLGGLLGLVLSRRPPLLCPPCQGGVRGGQSANDNPTSSSLNPTQEESSGESPRAALRPPQPPPGRGGKRISAALTAAGFALLFLSDQHRLQPWAWQFFILATVIALADDRTVFHGWRWLVISIYFWSALSKFDADFADRFQLQVFDNVHDLSMADTPMWLKPVKWPAYNYVDHVAWYVAFLMPCGELCAAILLMRKRTRRLGLLASLMMHGLLLAWLGPAGLNHKPGVLLWNMFFLAQNLLLFWMLETKEPLRLFRESVTWGTQYARWGLAAAMTWPAFVTFGLCDPWLGWAVYVPAKEQVWLEVDRVNVPQLPKALQSHWDFSWCGMDQYGRFAENRWSLTELDVPSYPQSRFQVGVYLDLYERFSLPEYERISPPTGEEVIPVLARHTERLGGQTRTREFTTPTELREYARTFRLNAFPESYYRRLAAERAAAAP